MKYFMKGFLLFEFRPVTIYTYKSVFQENNEIILETLLEIVTAYARNFCLPVKNVTPKIVFFRAS